MEDDNAFNDGHFAYSGAQYSGDEEDSVHAHAPAMRLLTCSMPHHFPFEMPLTNPIFATAVAQYLSGSSWGKGEGRDRLGEVKIPPLISLPQQTSIWSLTNWNKGFRSWEWRKRFLPQCLREMHSPPLPSYSQPSLASSQLSHLLQETVSAAALPFHRRPPIHPRHRRSAAPN